MLSKLKRGHRRVSGPPLVRLGIRVRRERAEAALAALLPLLPGGAEEADAGAAVEYAPVRAAGRAARGATSCARSLGDALLGVTRTDVAPGWETRWHEFLAPVEVASGARRLRIRPPWQPAGGDDGDAGGRDRPGRAVRRRHAPDDAALPRAAARARARRRAVRLGRRERDPRRGRRAARASAPVDAVEVSADGAAALIARNAAANGVDGDARMRSDLAEAPAAVGADRRREPAARRAAAIAARPLDPLPERLIASGVLTRPPTRWGRRARVRLAEASAGSGRLGGGRAGARVIRLAIRVDRARRRGGARRAARARARRARGARGRRGAIEYVIYGAPGEMPDAARTSARSPAARSSTSRRARSRTTGRSAGRPSTGRST